MTEDEHDKADGCRCGCEPLADHEATEDHDLPEALGGVEGDKKPRRRRPTRTSVGEDG